MLVGQLERINAIVGGLSGLPSGVSIQTLNHPVNSLGNIDLPACLPIPQQPIRYERQSANMFNVSVNWNLYLYLRAVDEGTPAQNFVEPLEVLDLFANEFLTRPQLQFNDGGLTGIVNNLEFRIIQGLSSPISYPVGVSNGAQYWGAVFQLSITQRQQYQMNVSGV